MTKGIIATHCRRLGIIAIIIATSIVSIASYAKDCSPPVIQTLSTDGHSETFLFINHLQSASHKSQLMRSVHLKINNNFRIEDYIQLNLPSQTDCLKPENSTVILTNLNIKIESGSELDFGGRAVLFLGEKIDIARGAQLKNYRTLKVISQRFYAPDFSSFENSESITIKTWDDGLKKAFKGAMNSYVYKMYLRMANSLYINQDAKSLEQAHNLYSAIASLSLMNISKEKENKGLKGLFNEANNKLNNLYQGLDIWGNRSSFLHKDRFKFLLEQVRSEESTKETDMITCLKGAKKRFDKNKGLERNNLFIDKNELGQFVSSCTLNNEFKKLIAFEAPVVKHTNTELEILLKSIQSIEEVVKGSASSAEYSLDKEQAYKISLSTIDASIAQLEFELQNSETQKKIEDTKLLNLYRRTGELDKILLNDTKYREQIQLMPTHEIGMDSGMTIMTSMASGAAAGSVGGPVGAVVGAAIGLVAGVVSSNKAKKAKELQEKINEIRKELMGISADKEVLKSANELADNIALVAEQVIALKSMDLQVESLKEQINSKKEERKLIVKQGQKIWDTRSVYRDFFIQYYEDSIYQFLWHYSRSIASLQKIMSAPIYSFSSKKLMVDDFLSNCKVSLSNLLSYDTLSSCFNSLELIQSDLHNVGLGNDVYYFYSNAKYNSGYTARTINIDNRSNPDLLKKIRCHGKLDYTFTLGEQKDIDFSFTSNDEDISASYEHHSIDDLRESSYCKSIEDKPLAMDFNGDLKNLLIQEVAVWYEFDTFSEKCEVTKSPNFKNVFAQKDLMRFKASEIEEVSSLNGQKLYFIRENKEGQNFVKLQGEDPKHEGISDIFGINDSVVLANILGRGEVTSLYNNKFKYMSPVRDWTFSVGDPEKKDQIAEMTRSCLTKVKIIYLLRYLN